MADLTPPNSNKGFLLRAQLLFVVLGGLYVVVLVLLAIPFFQTHILYLHAVNTPWSARFDSPEQYGLAPGKTLNLKLNTSDNITLGAWFVLSDPFYQSLPTPPPLSLDSHVPAALKSHPTILFFHGNAGNRAFRLRVQLYSALSSPRFAANVLAIDYRGFGDSDGEPSEAGLARDARAAWDWLAKAGARPGDVLVAGHSLGAAVAARLAADLAREDVRFRGLVVVAPFSSLRTLLDTYNIFGFFPLMKPLALIPGAPNLITRVLVPKFDTLAAIPEIKVPVVIVHAVDDWKIPYSHSEVLFNALLEPLLPPLSALPSHPTSLSKEDWADFTTQLSARGERRAQLVARRDIHDFGKLEEFTREETDTKVFMLKTREGEHDGVFMLEGVQNIVGSIFDLH